MFKLCKGHPHHILKTYQLEQSVLSTVQISLPIPLKSTLGLSLEHITFAESKLDLGQIYLKKKKKQKKRPVMWWWSHGFLILLALSKSVDPIAAGLYK